MDRNTFQSKKVIFLYPHSVIQQSLVRDLVENEYAIYLVSDHKKFRAIIGDFSEPIVFINIDEVLNREEWEEYIKELSTSADNTAQIGVLTYNEDKALAKTYLMDLMIPCGFIKLKLGLEQSRKIILKTLEANEAKGRRKYLRIDCLQLPNTGLNVKIHEKLFSGKIMDISSVGMAFVFNEPQELVKNSVLKDIQMRLRGKIAMVSGPVIGSRVTPDGVTFVMLFDATTSPEAKARIYGFIYETLQEEITKKITI